MKISKKAAAGIGIGGLAVFLSSIGVIQYYNSEYKRLRESSSEYRRLGEIAYEIDRSVEDIMRGCVLSADASVPSVCTDAVSRYSSLRSEEDGIKRSAAYNDLKNKLKYVHSKRYRSAFTQMILGTLILSFGSWVHFRRDEEEKEAENKPKIEETSSKNRIEASSDLQARIEQTGMPSSADYEAQCEAELKDFDERFEKKHGQLEPW